MKTLTNEELTGLAGSYSAPEGLYQYLKSLPFLGTVTSNISELVAGEWTEVVLTYVVGGSGLADGAWIKGTFKFYSVCTLDYQSTSHQYLSINGSSHLSRTGPYSKPQIQKATTMSQQNIFQTRFIQARHPQLSILYQFASTRRDTNVRFRKQLLLIL